MKLISYIVACLRPMQLTLISMFFGMFKSRGFCLEETGMREAERLKKLFALLTLALCWAVKVGYTRSNL